MVADRRRMAQQDAENSLQHHHITHSSHNQRHSINADNLLEAASFRCEIASYCILGRGLFFTCVSSSHRHQKSQAARQWQPRIKRLSKHQSRKTLAHMVLLSLIQHYM
jgi:hypothetical protein